MIASELEAFRAPKGFDHWLTPVTAEHKQVVASAANFGLDGVDFQLGINSGCHIDEAQMGGHYIGIQLNDNPMECRARHDGDWTPILSPPRAVWLHPDGLPFSARHDTFNRWAGFIFPRELMNNICGANLDLPRKYAVTDGVVSNLICSIIACVNEYRFPEYYDNGLVAHLTRSLIYAVGTRHAIELPVKGGIPPYQLRIINAWIENRLGTSFTIEEMAKLIGFSKSHFAREFKKTTNQSPWDYVIDRRIAKAQQLLVQGVPIAAVAMQCGFADQAHLCRVLKARQGISPSQIARRARLVH